MRKIKTQDVFKLARIIRISGAKNELAEILRASQNGNNGDARKVGVDLIMTLVSVCGEEEVEKMLYELIGGIAEKKPTDIMDLDLDELIELFKEIGEQNNLSNFFDTAVKSA